MNYLAHMLLSRPDAESLVGNLMGDFRKYLNGNKLPHNTLAGIQNHMDVDKLTDNHPLVCELKRKFSPDRRRFAGIILDVAFDYYLIKHWQQFSNSELEEFISSSHSSLESQWHIMPERMQYVMTYMIRDKWLLSYSDMNGIGYALDRMSKRIRFENKLSGAVEEVKENYDVIERGFLNFFPELLYQTELNQVKRQNDKT